MESYLDIARRVMREKSEARRPEPAESLESVLKGSAVELWSDSAGHLFLVADEEDAAKLGEPRGTVYTTPEAERIIAIKDPDVVAEIHDWKCRFDGRLGPETQRITGQKVERVREVG